MKFRPENQLDISKRDAMKKMKKWQGHCGSKI